MNELKIKKIQFQCSTCMKTEQIKLHTVPEMVTICPPALKCLVYLWEQLCTNCVEIVQSNVTEFSKERYV